MSAAWIIAAGVAVYGALMVLMYIGQRILLFWRPPPPVPTPEAAGFPQFERVQYPSTDKIVLHGWHHPPKSGYPYILYFQGNAGHTAYRAHKGADWAEHGFGVLYAGYRGYGDSEGSPTETGLYTDAEAALAFLAARGADQTGVILYGESLGTGVAAELAVRMAGLGRPALGLVLEAAYTSIADTASQLYPWLPARLMVRDHFETLQKIARIGAPLLAVHGNLDRVVPFAQGAAVYEAALEPKTHAWFLAANHTNLYEFGAGEAVLDFLEGLKPRTP